MVTLKLDRSRLEAKLRGYVRRSPAARAAAVKVMTREVITEVVQTNHRDTNRYVNGWALAGNQAGIGSFIVRPYAKAKWWNRIEGELRRRVSNWKFIVERYERNNRRDKWYRRAVAKLKKAEAEYARLAGVANGAVIAFNLFGGDRSVSIRPKIYGGSGRILQQGDRTFVVLHNLEAHASLVEWRFMIMLRARMKFRTQGLKVGGKAYLKRLTAA